MENPPVSLKNLYYLSMFLLEFQPVSVYTIVNRKNKETLSPPVGSVLRCTHPNATCIPTEPAKGVLL